MVDVMGFGTLAMDVLHQVDGLPGPGHEFVMAPRIYRPGGSCANVMVQLARLGVTCSFAGAVGEDAAGKAFIQSLIDEEIDTSLVQLRPGMTTIQNDVLVTSEGRRYIMLDMGTAFASYSLTQPARKVLRETIVLYTDLLPKAPAIALMEEAASIGVPIAINLQVDLATMEGFGWTREELLEVCAKASFIFCSREHLGGLMDTSLFDAPYTSSLMRELRDRGVEGTVVVTLGEGGSVAFPPNGEPSYAAALTAQTVDTTGAGDAYAGGFIYATLFEHLSLPETVRFANACAACTVESWGARTSPTLEQVRKRLAYPS